MAHFQIPLDLGHAGRIADRIVSLAERHSEELGVEAPGLMEVAEQLSNLLFRYTTDDENPIEEEAYRVRDEAATLGRVIVEEIVAAQLTSDRLGQLVRNLFECLELGEEGAEIPSAPDRARPH